MRKIHLNKALSLLVLTLFLFSALTTVLVSAQVMWYRCYFYTTTGGTISVSANGITYGEGQHSFTEGQAISINAVPDTGYTFDYYSFIPTGTTGTTTVNPISTTVYGSFTITAHFREVQTVKHMVTLDIINGGTAADNGVTITYNSQSYTVTEAEVAGATTYFARIGTGTSITIAAVSDVGYSFVAFEINGVNITDSSYTFTNDQDRDIVAYFNPVGTSHNDISVRVITDYATISGNGVKVEYEDVVDYVNEMEGGTSMWYRLAPGTVVNLTAIVDSGFTFTAFEINGANSTDPFQSITLASTFNTVKVYFTKTLTSHFIFSVGIETDQTTAYNNTVLVSYSSGVSLVHEGTDFWARIYSPKTITLEARADTDFTFQYFDVDGVRYETSTLTLNVADATTVIAYFTKNPYDSWAFDWGDFQTDLTTIVEMVVVAFILFGGVIILLKAPSAWIIGVILTLVGFFGNLLLQTNIYGLVVFGLEMVLFTVFLYSGTNTLKRSK